MSKLSLPPLGQMPPSVQAAFRAVAAWANTVDGTVTAYQASRSLVRNATTNTVTIQQAQQIADQTARRVAQDVVSRDSTDLVRSVLENMGTNPPININSPYLFSATGRDEDREYHLGIGASGILGFYNNIGSTDNIITFGITTTDGSFFFGADDPANTADPKHRQILFDATNNVITFGSSIVVRRSNGALETLEDIASSGGYTKDDLEDDLAAGVGNVLAGIGGDFRFESSADQGLIILKHKDVAFPGPGPAYSGTLRTGLIINANGIAMGYNNRTTGAFVTTMSLDGATGNLSVSGTINATAGNFAESVTVGGSTLLSAVVSGAASGATAVQPATLISSLSAKIDKNASYVLEASSEFKTSGYELTTAGSGGMNFTNNGIVARKRNAGNTGWVNTFVISSNGNATFSGELSAATGTFSGNISTSGQVVATGDTTSAVGNAAIVAAPATSSTVGVVGISTTSVGLWGQSTASTGTYGQTVTGYGVQGYSLGTGIGVGGYSASGTGVKAEGSTRALQVVGPMTINNSTLVANLNAHYLNGKSDSYFLPASQAGNHYHTIGGLQSSSEYRKFKFSYDGVTWANIYLKREEW